MTTENERISVSRDALRADLAEMELRLKSYISLELDRKASINEVESLKTLLIELRQHAVLDTGTIATGWKRFEEGTFTTSQKLAIGEMIENKFEKQNTDKWTGKERIFAGLGALVAVFTMVFTGIYTLDSRKNVSVTNPTTTSATTTTGKVGP